MAKTTGQKCCLGMILLGCLGLLAGSAAPGWAVVKGLGQKKSYGAWYYCQDILDEKDCYRYTWDDIEIGDYSRWFFSFHGATGVATLISLFLVVICLAKLCGDSDSVKSAGGSGLMAGLLGIAAAVVLYLKTADSMAIFFLDDDHLDWAFYVFSSGSGLLTIFSAILLFLPNDSDFRVSNY